MKNKTQKQHQIDPVDVVRRRYASEVYSGVAYKHIPLNPAMFCAYQDDGKNWFCPRCFRKIDKQLTDGDMPISVCNAIENSKTAGEGVYPVRVAPKKVGEVVPRNHRSVPLVGVGHSLMRAFRMLKISIPETCNCSSRLLYLSTLPISEVQRFEPKVLGWFEEEANHRAMYYDEAKAKKLLQIAYRHATKTIRKAALKLQEQNG